MFLTFCSSQFHLPAHIAHNMPKYHILNYLIILVFPLQYVSVMYFLRFKQHGFFAISK